jgi:hypothetical protein
MSEGWCDSSKTGLRLRIHVVPNAKKTEVVGVTEDALKIRLHAQPIEGKANDALVRFIADRLSVPKSTVAITRGQSAKKKVVEIAGCVLTAEQAAQILLP